MVLPGEPKGSRRSRGIHHGSRAQQERVRADRLGALASLMEDVVWEGSQLRGIGSSREEEMEANPRETVLS